MAKRHGAEAGRKAQTAPAKKAPAKKAAAKKVPAKTPAKEAPAKKAPAKEAPAKKAPVTWAELTNRGNVRQDEGDFGGAIADFTRAINLAPDELAPRYNRGNARTLAGDLEGAVKDYTEALRLDPGFAPAYTRRGLARQRLGDLGGAEEDLQHALTIAPEDPDAYGTRGSVRALRGDYEGARADCERALALAPADWKHRPGMEELLEQLRDDVTAEKAEGSAAEAGEEGEAGAEGEEGEGEQEGRAIAAVEEVLKATGWSYERESDEEDEEGWVNYVCPVDQGAVGAITVRVSELLQRFLLYVIYQPQAAKARRGEVVEFVTRANDGLCDGNFEMSYEDGEVRYKVAIDWSGAALEPMLVRNAVLNAMDMSEAYEGALTAVLKGKKTAKQAIEEAERDL